MEMCLSLWRCVCVYPGSSCTTALRNILSHRVSWQWFCRDRQSSTCRERREETHLRERTLQFPAGIWAPAPHQRLQTAAPTSRTHRRNSHSGYNPFDDLKNSEQDKKIYFTLENNSSQLWNNTHVTLGMTFVAKENTQITQNCVFWNVCKMNDKL